MPFRDELQHLRHIDQAISQVQDITAGLDLESFQSSLIIKLAVERLLQIITEAAYRLGREASVICPGVDWRDVRGFGNILRHEYDKLTAKTIWQTVVDDLPPLKAAVSSAILLLETDITSSAA